MAFHSHAHISVKRPPLTAWVFGALVFFAFCLGASSAQATNWPNGYSSRRTLTIDHTKVPNTDQTNFPFLFRGTYTFLATQANGGVVVSTSGYDIIISTDPNGASRLAHEIETYSSTTGNVAMWAQVPSVSHSTDTVLYLFYGNASISTSQENTMGVWDTNFKDVWHLKNGVTLSGVDSTNNLAGTIATPTATTGMIDGAGSFSGSDRIFTANTDVTYLSTAHSLSAWIKATNSGAIKTVVRNAGGSSNDIAMVVNWTSLDATATNVLTCGGYSGSTWTNQYVKGTTNVNDGNWHYVACVYNGTTLTPYVDGVADATPKTLAGSIATSASSPWNIGRYPVSAAEFFVGTLDEVRISRSARSADWIATEFCNQSTSCVFYSTGSENSVSNPVITTVSTTTVTATWGASPMSSGYDVEASTASDFSGTIFSSVTLSTSVLTLAAGKLSDLSPNTTYFIRVGALFGATTAYANTIPISTSTLAVGVTGASISYVGSSSVTISWTALPASPSSSTAEGYRVDASSDPAFGSITASSITTNVNVTSLTVTGLSGPITYYFRVGSLNWNGVANNGSVSGSAYMNGWPNGYLYRRPIVIDHTKVPNTDQTNFPFLFRGTYTFLATQANGGVVFSTSGYDIVFSTDSNGGSRLAHEIETYSSTTGNVNMWTQVPTVSHSTDTVIYLFYGNASITTTQENKAGVWDSNYKGVWHVPNGTTLSLADSTSNGNNASNNGATATAGQMDGGMSTNGATYATIGTPASLANLAQGNATFSAWVNTASGAGGRIMGKDDNNVNKGWGFALNNTHNVDFVVVNNGADMRAVSTATTGNSTWTYVTVTLVGSASAGETAKIYINGALDSTTSGGGGGTGDDSGQTAYLANATYGDQAGAPLNGLADEFRLSNVIRTADWISTEYCNQSTTCVFYSTGTENSITHPIITAVSSTTVTATWDGSPVSSGYDLEASTASDFSGTLFSSVTASASVLTLAAGRQSALSPNTTYFIRVGALFGATTAFVNTVPVSTSTLAQGVTGASISYVGVSSVTISWTALPASPSSSTAEGYRVDVSTDLAFGSILASSITTNVNVSSLTVTGLSGAITYYFRVGTLNWNGVANNGNVPGSVYINAWPNGYLYRRTIVIDHTKIPNTDQNNFPFLFRGTYTFLATQANGGVVVSTSGYDIIFSTDPNGSNRLAHEIETYSSTTGNVNMWVQVSTVSHSTDTVVYLFYGKSSITTSQENRTSVWDSNYKGVWHLPNGTTLTANDSTSNAANGTPTNSPVPIPGQIGGAASFTAASSHYITMGNTEDIAAQDFTIGYWVKAPNANIFSTLISKRTSGGTFKQYDTGIGSVISSGGSAVAGKTIFFYGFDGSTHSSYHTTADVIDGNWHYAVISRTSAGFRIYIDGANVAITTDNSGAVSENFTNTANFNFGYDNTSFYSGSLDEPRVSVGIARSSDWISAEFCNQSTACVFYSTGSENSVSNPVITSASTATVTAAWDGSPESSGYDVEASTVSDFSGTLFSSVTVSTSVLTLAAGKQSDLSPNTTYFIRVGALFGATTAYANTTPISTSTLAQPVTGTAISYVGISSATISWTALPASPSSSTAEGYRVDASSDPAFGSIAASSITTNVNVSSLTLTGLVGPTTYYFRVGTLNWNGVANNGSVPGSAYISTWPNSYLYRRAIVIDHTKVPNTDQTNFPFLFRGTYTFLATQANGGVVVSTSGYDIVFSTDPNGGSRLAHEIEIYSSTTGNITMWTQVPLVSHNTDTVIYLFYGNGAIVTSQENRAGVWDANYKLVWHLANGTTLSAGDSTSNADSGTITNATATGGLIDGAGSFNGSNTILSTTTLPTAVQDNWTVQAWMNPSSLSQLGIAVFNGRDDGVSGTYNGYGFGVGNGAGASGSKLQGLFSGVVWVDSGYTFGATGTWYHVVMERASGTTKFYVNGTQTASTSASTPGVPTFNFTVGAQKGPSATVRYFNGLLDEVRVSAIARSADWINTEYCNQSASCVFYSTGSENSVGNPVFTTISSSTLTVGWSAGVSLGTGYELDISTASDFTGTVMSSVTLSSAATTLTLGTLSPLAANTTYFARVGTLFSGTTNYGATVPSSTSTLTGALLGAQVYQVFGSSLTANWVAFTAGSGSNTAEGYRLEASTAADFSGVVFSSSTSNVALSTLTVSGLSFVTSYYLRVGALNWNGVPTYSSLGSTTTVAVNWANGYLYRRSIVIDHAKVPNTDQSNFPFLFRGTFTYLTPQASGGVITSTSGYDIIFSTDPTGTSRLSHEIETYSSTTGNVNMWVRIPTVSHSFDTTVYLFYSNSAITTSQENRTGVWDSDFKGVWHLSNGTTLNATDSTSNGNNGGIGGATAAAGQIDGSANFNGSAGINNGAPSNLPTGTSARTSEIWFKLASSAANQSLAGWGDNGTDGHRWNIWWFGSNTIGFETRNNAVTTTFNYDTNWHHFVAVNPAGNTLLSGVLLYLDGVSQTISPGAGSFSTSGSNLTFGTIPGAYGFNYYSGQLDEIRISSSARSGDWISTEYCNQSTSCVFYSVGTQDGAVVTAVSSFTITANWASNGAGNGYDLEASTAADFTGTLFSSTSFSTSTVILTVGSATPLSPNTTYFLRLGQLAGATTNYLSTPLGSTVTWTTPVTGGQIYGTFISSITANWLAYGPGSGVNTATSVRLEVSTASNFSGTVFSSVTTNVAVSTLTVVGLTNGTTYYLRVGAVNWIGAANYSSLGSRVTAFSNWPNGYSVRRVITIDHTKVPNTDQTNFPFLFRGTFASMANETSGGILVSTSGYDMIFSTDPAGASRLSHEIESYSSTTGNLAMWVNIPTVSHTVDTVIYAFYGNAAVTTSLENRTAVWDSNFQMVLHMKETTNPYRDSTSNNYASTGGTNPTSVSGIIGDAESFNGTSQYIAFSQAQSPNPSGSITAETWIKTSVSPVIMGKWASDGLANGNQSWAFLTDGTGKLFAYFNANNSADVSLGATSGPINDGQWHHVAATAPGGTGTIYLYVDGTQVGSLANSNALLATTSDRLLVGAVMLAIGANYTNGLLDEVRISNSVRAADWLATEYCNQSLSCSFYNVGGENGVAVTAVSTYTITTVWTDVATGTVGYDVDVSTASDFSGTVFSSATTNVSATSLTVGYNNALTANTTYFVRVAALSSGATSYIYTTPLSTSTLANLVTGGQIYQVFGTSITANWIPLSAGSGPGTAEGYAVQASTDGTTFSPVAGSSSTPAVALSTLTVRGLHGVTTYTLRVGALNWNGTPNFVTIGSTQTLTAIFQWTGSGGTSWNTAGSWDQNNVPGPTDNVVIDTNSVNQPVFDSTATIFSLSIASSGVYGSTMTMQAPLTVSSGVIVGGRGVISAASNASADVYKSSITANFMSVSGLINVTGLGWAGAASGACSGNPLPSGPGAGSNGIFAGGGSYGGQGQLGGITYGSYSAPVNSGSGGADQDNCHGPGGSGGGVIVLNVTNALTLNGSFLAKGTGGSNYGGGGAGGSIYVTAGSLAGAGTMDVSGGIGAGDMNFGGGGGRIAVIASTAGFSGSLKAYGGTGPVSQVNASNGTIYINNGQKTLIVDNNGAPTMTVYAVLPAADYSSTFDQIQLNHQGNLLMANSSIMNVTAANVTGDGTTGYLRIDGTVTVPSPFTLSGYGLLLSSMTIFSGLNTLTVGGARSGAISHEYNSTTDLHKASMTLTNLTVASNGAIDASGHGARGTPYGACTTVFAANGPGVGSAVVGKGGGSYGGQGEAGGNTYGSYNAPLNSGSAGASPDTCHGPSGNGGGVVVLNVTGSLTLNGSILASGTAGSLNGGGGSGGSVYITAPSLTGAGAIDASGGACNGLQPLTGGGGGRIAVMASTASFSGSIRAYGGSGVSYGSPGTIYLKPSGTNGTLVVNNNGNVPVGVTYLGTPTSSGTYTFDSIYTAGKSSVTFVSFSTVTVVSPGNVFGDGDFTSTATVNGVLNGGAFSNISSTTLRITWGTSPNTAGQTYTLELSSTSDYSAPVTSTTANRFAAFSSLVLGTTYYARVQPGGYVMTKVIPSNYAILGSTVTRLSTTPLTPRITAVSVSSLTVTWTIAEDVTGGYSLEASTASDFSGTLYSSTTADNFLSTMTFNLGTLAPDTTYFVRIGGLNGGTTSYAPTAPASTSTLTNLLSPTLLSVSSQSITVGWPAFAINSGTNTAQGYELDISTSANFITLQGSSITTSVAQSTLTISNLSASMTYYLRAGALNWNAVPNFATALSTITNVSPWPNGYYYRRAIVIDHTKVPNTDQTNFPFLFRGTYTFLATQANSGVVVSTSGYDIVFSTDPNGAVRLSHEIETYSSTTGNVNMWANVPTISHTADTVLYLFYGNSAITTSQENKTSVWDGNYRAVYHLPNGSTLNATDSTSNGNNGTASNATPASGEIDGAASFAGNGYITHASFNLNATTVTASAWVYSTNFNQNGMVIEKDPVNADWALFFSGANLFLRGNSVTAVTVANPSNSNWHYLVATISSGTTGTIYIDGNQAAQGSVTAIANTTNNLNIGDYGAAFNGFNFTGIIDEVRVSSAIRSADWIATEYCNQNVSCVFYSTGAENVVAFPAITAVSSYTLTSTWASGLAIAAGYDLEVSTASDFSGTLINSVTASTSALSLTVGSTSALTPNTTYFARVGALFPGSTSYAITVPVSASTLTGLVTGVQIYQVFGTSIAVTWTPFGAGSGANTSEGYRVTVSTASDFSGTVFSSATTNPAVSTLTVVGLNGQSTYYVRTGALNWNSVPNYVSAGSTQTLQVSLHWTGQTNSSWTVAGNWDGNIVPGTFDIVIIDTNSANQPVLDSTSTIYALYIASSGVFGSTLTLRAPLTVSSGVIVGAQGVITHPVNPAGTSEVYIGSITANFMVLSGMISVSGKGFPVGYGTGYSAGCGGGYGGESACAFATTAGAGYGSYQTPVNLGSSGSGGAGGGAIILNVATTLTLSSGGIYADGNPGFFSGSGSGGSIYIQAAVLAGSGTLSAQSPNAPGNGNAVSGGGGRISIIASTAAFTGTYQAWSVCSTGGCGGAGTVFLRAPGTNGTLMIDNNNAVTPLHSVIAAANYTGVFDRIQINRLGNLWMSYPSTMTLTASNTAGDGTQGYLRVDGVVNMPATFTLSGYGLLMSSMTTFSGVTDLTIGGSLASVVAHEYNTTAEVHKASFTVTNLTVAANGKIDATLRGYASLNGPGARHCSTGGASYGGEGYASGCQGSTYGSYSAPTNLGSGGDSLAGGGAIILNVANTLNLLGSIRADSSSARFMGYGASGGSIYIQTNALTGNGTLSAQGGFDSDNGIGGGGGRIAVIGSTTGFSGSYQAYGGTGGAAGTIFLKPAGSNGTLVINANNITTPGITYLASSTTAGAYTFDSIYTLNKSSIVFVSFSTVTISPNGNVFGDGDVTSTATINGNLYGGFISSVTQTSLTARWGTSPNTSSQTYTVDASTSTNYAAPLISSTTANRFASLILPSGTTYYLRVRANGYTVIRSTPSNFALLGSTCTLPASAPTGFQITAVNISSITTTFNPSGLSNYTLDASTASDFSGTLISSVSTSLTANTLSFNSGTLAPDTTYYLRLGGLSGGTTLYATPNLATSTLTNLLQNAVISQVGGLSVTANWTAFSLGSGTNTAQGYELDASTASDFTGTLLSSSTNNPAVSTLTISGMGAVSTYYLRAGAYNFNSVANFILLGSTTTSCSSAYSNGYCFRRAITVDHTKVPNIDQTEFPLLYRGTFTYLATSSNGGVLASTSGYDMMFSTDPYGASRLPHEIETYSSTTGNVNMWVQVPTLSHTSDTTFYLFYSNPAITTSQENRAGVWDSSYTAVYHLADGTTLNENDSTSNAYNGTNHSATAVSGQIDGAANFSGSSQYFENAAANLPAAPDITISFWSRVTSAGLTGNSGFAFNTVNGGTRVQAHTPWSDSTLYWDYGNSAGGRVSTSYATYLDTWTYVVLVGKGNNSFQAIYLNGVSKASQASGGAPSGTISDLTVGGSVALSLYQKGVMDEFRVSKIVRSADWIQTEFNNQCPTCNAFVSVGPATSPSTNPVVTAVSSVTLTASWSGISGTTGYDVEVSTASDFSGSIVSSVTLSTSVFNLTVGLSTTLIPDTTYYARVGGLFSGATSYVNTTPASTSTLTNLLSPSVLITSSQSVTVGWPAFATNSGTNTAQGYELDVSTSANFVTLQGSSVTTSVSVSTLTIANLSAATTYYVRVGAINWNNVANFAAVLSTKTVAVPSWSNGYLYRRAIVIDHTKVPNTDQTNFPFLFRGTYTFLATQANGGVVVSTSGYDIIFSTDPIGSNRLAHEIETYSSTTGNVNMWTLVPAISHSTDTILYLFYGNSSITSSQQNINGVWDSNYKAVWHLANGTILSAADSTSNANNATPTAGVTAIAGQIDGAANVDGGAGHKMSGNASWPAAWTTLTFTSWFKTTSVASFHTAMQSSQSGNGWGVNLNGNLVDWYARAIADNNFTSLTVTANKVYYVAITRNGGTVIGTLYNETDGTSVTQTLTSVTAPNTGDGSFLIGNSDSGNTTWNGWLDEMRVSTITRSADWISTEYCNQSAACVFYSTGTENGAANPLITAVSTNTITATWGASSMGSGYDVEASTASDFSGTLFSSVTVSTSVLTLATGNQSPLSPNTTYFIRVGSFLGATTAYANTVPLSTSTLAQAVTNAAIYYVGSSSVTITWAALPASPSSSTAEGYRLDASIDPAFGSTAASSVTTSVSVSTLTITNLSASTTYYVRIGAINWNNSPNFATVLSTKTVAAPGWPNGYLYRRAIVIDHTKVPNTDQTNFPFLFRGTYTYLATPAFGGVVTSTSGYDILFSTDPLGASRLSQEIETYSSMTGTVNMWMKVPTVSHSTDTIVYLFYGNSAVTTSQANPTGVWDANYKAVWHLPDGSVLSAADSTSNGNNGTINSVTASTGQIDGAGYFNGSGSTNIDMGNAASFNITSAMSIEMWMNPANTGSASLLRKGAGGAGVYYLYYVSGIVRLAINDVGWNFGGYTLPSQNQWYHVVGTFDGSNRRVYVNGVLQDTQGQSSAINTNAANVTVGNNGAGGEAFTGYLDEVKVSAVARSGDWIATEYCNQNVACALSSIGTSLSVTSPVITAVSTYTLTAGWVADVPNGSGYTLEVSTASDFSGTLISSVTTSTSTVSLTVGLSNSLAANTTYYARIAVFVGTSTIYGNTTPPSTSTLTGLVTGAQIYRVYGASVTANWTAFSAGSGAGTSEGYQLQASTDGATFFPVTSSSVTTNVLLSTLTVNGLHGVTTYTLRVAGLNWNNVPNTSRSGQPKRRSKPSINGLV